VGRELPTRETIIVLKNKGEGLLIKNLVKGKKIDALPHDLCREKEL